MENKQNNAHINIRTLIDYLNARTKEYDEGKPTISDSEWDKVYFRLQELENRYSIYFNDSPTQSISYEVVNALEKSAHNHDMLSLEKTKDEQVIRSFLGNQAYLAMCKMDGLTCSLKYENGELISAETRGNGKVGENILHNAKVIPTIPKKIPYTKTLVVDGEIICSKYDFVSFENEYKNPRNFASGSIRLLDSKECSKRKLQFIAWDVIEGFNEYELLSDKLRELILNGFTIVPYDHEEFDFSNCVNFLKDTAEVNGYPIDGIVFKFNDIAYGKSLGQTDHHFKNAIAFKFEDEVYDSKLLGIDWTMGRTGVLTPVAMFEAIDMDDSIVERASLHNVSMLYETLGTTPHIGQPIKVAKMNMIIPQIVDADKDPYIITEHILNVPCICPICGSSTVRKKDLGTETLICNNLECSGQLINRLDHFAGKKGLDIKGLSKATLEKLIDWGWVSNCEDLFTLKEHRAEWIKLPGFGIKSVDKILNAIESSRECELSAFIAALGIPLIGSTASKELSKIFIDWESFINAVKSNYQFYLLPNFGGEMDYAIIHFNYGEAESIYNKYLIIKRQSQYSEATNSLNGLNFVITGKVNHYKNRDELKSIIEANGGKVVGSVSSKTNYLINNDVNSTSSKNATAQKLGVPVISEDAFIEMFNLL